ncbi:MAG: PilN domain-containing protein [Candidatus Melainabacteria bacterium]|nr:PilN domain-containing protein [Candidatus Melainabacteria bacterium]
MSKDNLTLDFSEEYITMHCRGIHFSSDISSEYFWNNTEEAIQQVKQEIVAKGFLSSDLTVTLPITCINYQIVTLPDNVSDKEKLVFLGLELNKKLIGKRFGIRRLDVTARDEAEQALCDYIVIAPKSDVFTKLEQLAKALERKIASVVPSFFVLGADRINELRATAWLGHDRTEIVIWGKDNPLALAHIPSTGDQIGDVNRFIVEYFDHVDDLSLSMIFLYGPKMRDESLGFALSYPHGIFANPTKYLADNLGKAKDQLDISKVTKLPKPPIAMTPRNLSYIGSAVAVAILVFLSVLTQAGTLREESRLKVLERKSSSYRKQLATAKKLEQESAELNAEKDFYLGITKRRTPWATILADLSDLTPSEMWYERVNATKNKILILGKARATEDVSALSINLNNSSAYFKDALIIGTRDFEDDSKAKYSEFQLQAKLKSPTGEFTESPN